MSEIVAVPVEAHGVVEPAADVVPGARGLRSRHILIDSSVWIKFHVQLQSKLLVDLWKAAADFGLTLHIGDQIVFEVGRWLKEQATDIATEQKALNKKLVGWNRRQGAEVTPVTAPIDPVAAAEAARQRFAREVVRPFRAVVRYHAEDVPMSRILDLYRREAPPFDNRGKEFPDAIIIEGARSWAEDENELIYVISGDGAMLRHAKACERLLPVGSLAEFLQIIAETRDPAIVVLIDEIVDEPGFMQKLTDAIGDAIPMAPFAYGGYSLADAEVQETVFQYISESRGWTVVSVDGDSVSFVCVVDFAAEITVALVGHVEDEDGSRDFGSDEWEDEFEARIYIRYDRRERTILEIDWLSDIKFGDNPEWERDKYD